MELWVKNRDGNTKFFHTSIIVHRRRNFIPLITLDNGLKTWGRDQIGNYFLNQFNSVFSSDNPILDTTLKYLLP